VAVQQVVVQLPQITRLPLGRGERLGHQQAIGQRHVCEQRRHATRDGVRQARRARAARLPGDRVQELWKEERTNEWHIRATSEQARLVSQKRKDKRVVAQSNY